MFTQPTYKSIFIETIMATKVIVRIVRKASTDGNSVLCLESIRRPTDTVTYEIPIELQIQEHHTEIFDLMPVRRAVRNIKRNGQYRHLTLTLSLELFEKYTDQEGNFVFQEFYLEETEICRKPSRARSDSEAESGDEGTADALKELVKSLKDITDFAKSPDAPPGRTVFDLSKAEKDFNIQPFTGKEKASDWLETFENECARFKIPIDEQKIKCLKVFMKGSAEQWYRSTQMKLPDDTWSLWSESFRTVFGDKGWSKMRYAFSYKYIAGSFVDYALKKECLILEIEKEMTTTTRINLIVHGLPIDIQDKLDKEEISTTDQIGRAHV